MKTLYAKLAKFQANQYTVSDPTLTTNDQNQQVPNQTDSYFTLGRTPSSYNQTTQTETKPPEKIPEPSKTSQKQESSKETPPKKPVDPPQPPPPPPPEEPPFDNELFEKLTRGQNYNPSDDPNVISVSNSNTYWHSLKEVSLYGPTDTLYIYCDVVKPTPIGNIEAQLLRRVGVPTDKNFGDLCEINYTRPEYYPVLFEEIERIEIDIRDDSANRVNFRFGKVALTLHFRKKLI